jgi:hypothetical protein
MFVESIGDARKQYEADAAIDPQRRSRAWTSLLSRAFEQEAVDWYRSGCLERVSYGDAETLVAGLIRAGEPAVIGGAEKSMKTCLSIDLAAAIATGTPFLGREVKRSAPVWAFTAETGLALWTKRFISAVNARGLDGQKVAEAQLTVTNRLESLRTKHGRSELADFIRLAGVAVAIIDPLYLATRAMQTSDFVGQGQALRRLVKCITRAGAAPVIVTHLLRSAVEGVPPALRDLQGCATAAFARSWLLVARCGEYAGNGEHRLAARTGTSAGHHGLLNITFDEWKWAITANPVESPQSPTPRRRTLGTKG